MRKLAWIWVMVAAITALAPDAGAEPATLEVTVSYRERIALPPGAELEVELLDISGADATARRIASQRFAMTGVPMTVALPHDRQLAGDGTRLALGAVIWSGDRRVFALTSPQVLPDGAGAGPVEVRLDMVPDPAPEAGPAWPVRGVVWRVTEVLGEPWAGGDPATLAIDDTMQVSVFGGCNRYVGQVRLAGREIGFPPDFAGTLMACPDAVEAQERAFLAALRRVTHLVRYGAGLVLMDAGGTALLHFEPAPG
ncbi:MAG: META domain-containing protein [Rhodobacteraceae bacterium]|nr:META domain-containing protein [Paracoccaceae bacterium]